jgi:hypothetical protein
MRILFLVLLLMATALDAAVPTYRGESATGSGAGGSGNATPSAPAGLATGDLEILIGSTEFAGSPTISITTPGGSAWTAFTGTPVNGTTGIGEVLYGWWRIRQAGDSDPTLTNTGDHTFCYRMAIVAGTFNSASPIEIENTGSENNADQSYSYAPGTSTLGPDRLVLATAASQLDSAALEVTAAVNATLSNVQNTAYGNTTNGNGGGANTCRGELATAGSVGTFSATWTTSSRKNYFSFAVKPVTTTTNPGAFLQMF